MGGFLVQVRARSDHHAEFTVLDGQRAILANLQVQILPPESFFDDSSDAGKKPVVLRYPGKATHPAGDLAPISWFNEAGRGLLRVVGPGRQLVILPLLGLQLSPHAPDSATKGSRGPSRASELWLAVAAWCLPGGFTIPDLIETTGLSQLTVRNWMKNMVTVGLVVSDPVLSAIGNLHRYVYLAERRASLANLVIGKWQEWKSGTGHPSLRPDYRHFVAKEPWKAMQKRLKNEQLICYPSGITVLEGGPGAGSKSWLMPPNMAGAEEVFLYTTKADLSQLVKYLDITLVVDAADSNAYLSTICVLPDDHPAIRLYERRRKSGIYTTGWPWGLAALDALDHQDARVRQAAEDAWKDWIDNQDVEATKLRTRNG
jgi:hypothetical protein